MGKKSSSRAQEEQNPSTSEKDASTFAGSKSMRNNYEDLGVDQYYSQHGATYRNPHAPGIIAASAAILDTWWTEHCRPRFCSENQGAEEGTCPTHTSADGNGTTSAQPTLQFFDLACGSGEATQAVETWFALRQGRQPLAYPPPAPEQASDGGEASGGEGASEGQASDGPEGGQQPSAAAPEQQPGQDHASSDGPADAAGDHASGSEQAAAAAGECQALDVGADQGPAAAEAAAADAAPVASSSSSSSTGHAGCAAAGEGQEHGHELATGEDAAAAAAATGPYQASHHSSSGPQSPAPAGAGAAEGVSPEQLLPPQLQLRVDAADPYTGEAYRAWTGRAAEAISFQDVAQGAVSERAFHVIICSYALHVMDASNLFSTLMQLSLVCDCLIVLAPHKLPHIQPHMGWQLKHHVVIDRVHARLYTSTNLWEEVQERLQL